MAKRVYLMAVDGFADWEPAHALAELRRYGHYDVVTVGVTDAPVTSMGGLRILPSMRVTSVEPSDVAAFVLPGGDRWQEGPLEPELVELLHQLDDAGVPLAAICAATVAVTRAGLLRGRRHTSNGLAYLQKYAAGYSESDRYVDAPAVRDRKLITASGLADVEFARELFEELDVLPAAARGQWAEMFRSGRVPSAS